MAEKARVHELARELGIPAREVLARLKQQGEFVTSASSLVEAPVARQLRESSGCAAHASLPETGTPPAAPRRRRPLAAPAPEPEPQSGDTSHTIQPRHASRSITRRPRREWYRGPEPAALTRYLLDNLVVRTRDPFARPPGTAYWADEVQDAQDLAGRWAPALLSGLGFAEILAWIESRYPVLKHIESFARLGIGPSELGPSRHDRGGPTLGVRLSQGTWSVEKIISEVQRRRSLS